MPPLTGYDYFLENALTHGWMIPRGAIIMWSGTIASIPAGWAFCNGANNTPDLRDRFVVSAKQDDGGVAKSNVETTLKQTGGELSHNHPVSDYGHTHGFTGNGHDHAADYSQQVAYGSDFYAYDAAYNTASGAANGTTDSAETGISISHVNTVPPYYALAFIMKT